MQQGIASARATAEATQIDEVGPFEFDHDRHGHEDSNGPTTNLERAANTGLNVRYSCLLSLELSSSALGKN